MLPHARRSEEVGGLQSSPFQLSWPMVLNSIFKLLAFLAEKGSLSEMRNNSWEKGSEQGPQVLFKTRVGPERCFRQALKAGLEHYFRR